MNRIFLINHQAHIMSPQFLSHNLFLRSVPYTVDTEYMLLSDI